jgi:hypothetical protein
MATIVEAAITLQIVEVVMIVEIALAVACVKIL